MLLAIDTSTALTGIACYDARGVVGECSWLSGRDHTAQLLPQLSLLLRHIGRARDEIAAVAVALGPGSWSGLRVGLSTAKGFALARDLPIVGVGTLEALAYQHACPGLPVFPLIRLGRGRYATAEFGPADPLLASPEPRSSTLDELATSVGGGALFCGDIDGEVQETLSRALGDRARFPSSAANLRRPGYLAEIGWQRLHAGRADAAAALEPLYLGQPTRILS
jgi:tRNA threonylcarbamoyladenosine biosynthesis protein TsaB